MAPSDVKAVNTHRDAKTDFDVTDVDLADSTKKVKRTLKSTSLIKRKPSASKVTINARIQTMKQGISIESDDIKGELGGERRDKQKAEAWKKMTTQGRIPPHICDLFENSAASEFGVKSSPDKGDQQVVHKAEKWTMAA